MHRYNPYYDPFYQRPNPSKHSTHQENQYDNVNPYVAANYGKKRKPKPFSVMLDIYPITDTAEQTKISSRLKSPTTIDDSDLQRPLIPLFPRRPKVYGKNTQSSHQTAEDDEKHQMILHLNLYPKRKNKLTR